MTRGKHQDNEVWTTYFDLYEVSIDGAEWPEFIAVTKKETNQHGEIRILATMTYVPKGSPHIHGQGND